MSTQTMMAQKVSYGVLGTGASLMAALTSPIAQLATFGGIDAFMATNAAHRSAIAIVCWIAAAISVAAIIHLLAARREPSDTVLPTNTSAIAFALVEMVALTSMWLLFAPNSRLSMGVVGLFSILTALDVLDRILFVMRMHRQGGVKAEARRIVEHIVRQHAEDAHGLISEESFKHHGRSRLHWRLSEALSAENMALYEREATKDVSSTPVES